MFDLEAREQRDVVLIMLDQLDLVRHHGRHEGDGLFVNILGVNEDLADFLVEIISDGANHEVRFQVDEVGRGILYFS